MFKYIFFIKRGAILKILLKQSCVIKSTIVGYKYPVIGSGLVYFHK